METGIETMTADDTCGKNILENVDAATGSWAGLFNGAKKFIEGSGEHTELRFKSFTYQELFRRLEAKNVERTYLTLSPRTVFHECCLTADQAAFELAEEQHHLRTAQRPHRPAPRGWHMRNAFTGLVAGLALGVFFVFSLPVLSMWYAGKISGGAAIFGLALYGGGALATLLWIFDKR
jgi:hypothetical protein